MKLLRLPARVRDISLSAVTASTAEKVTHYGRSGSGHLRLRGRALQERNQRIRVRDGYTCQACGCVADAREGQVDHKVPLHAGGTDDDSNVQWLCNACHVAKTNREQQQ